MTAITLNFHSVVDLTDKQFSKLCQINPDIKLERTVKGELILMPPTGGETGDRFFTALINKTAAIATP